MVPDLVILDGVPSLGVEGMGGLAADGGDPEQGLVNLLLVPVGDDFFRDLLMLTIFEDEGGSLPCGKG